MSFDTSGLPDRRFAPFSEEQVALIRWYQNESSFHSYTCCDHQTMEMTARGLICPKCLVIQDWILESTFKVSEQR